VREARKEEGKRKEVVAPLNAREFGRRGGKGRGPQSGGSGLGVFAGGEGEGGLGNRVLKSLYGKKGGRRGTWGKELAVIAVERCRIAHIARAVE